MPVSSVSDGLRRCRGRLKNKWKIKRAIVRRFASGEKGRLKTRLR
ncbi:hypothetical protein NEIELOOT_00569 [Neisseria elongata subsp. glycolytica ATCC 29315]|uniref:Uncharacterized protein n=1 Tax=Neisseria elongata subsp. glycolytica ATCC 29315 TaxID=546263 RepID=D4DNF6_NEIEG|nr:hypothetical protein NEIELOOT_00569 [Neisseria elongata subsp. glycolytica ATCC 29315]